MSDLEHSGAIAYVNSLIGDKIRSQIVYGNDNIPNPYIPATWFAGTKAAPNLPAFPNPHDAFTGDANAAKINEAMHAFTRKFAIACKKRMIVYYNSYGSLVNMFDVTAIGNYATAPALPATAKELVQNTDATQASFTDYCNALYQEWWQSAGNPVVETLTTTYCHSSCHSSCHSDCHSNYVPPPVDPGPVCYTAPEPVCYTAPEPVCYTAPPPDVPVCYSDCYSNCHGNRGRR